MKKFMRCVLTGILASACLFSGTAPGPAASQESRPTARRPEVTRNPMEFAAYVKEYPESRLAKGCREYEKITGTPYFTTASRTSADRYRPKREVRRWPGFLSRFPDHPGADDAAYRLGRCLEIQGRPFEALSWFAKAAEMPDGDMAADVRGRALFLLDVLLDDETLKKGRKIVRSEDLRRSIQYSLAVRWAREGRWKEALDLLDPLLEGAGTAPSFAFLKKQGTGFSEALQRQKSAWNEATTIQQASSVEEPPAAAKSLYRLGSLFYRDELVFYNHLWEGARTGYLFFRHALKGVMLDGKNREKYRSYLWRHNNYLQALRIFEILRSGDLPDGPLREKVQFSIGMCLYRAANYGYEMKLIWPLDEWHEKIAREFGLFIREFPSSSMTDDALLMVGVYGRDAEALRRLLREFPDSDNREKARKYLEMYGYGEQ